MDVVFLDIEMPMLNGITLGKQISEELPAPPEIIYVTAFPEYSLDAWDIGAFGYILKPYDPKQISAVLNRVLKYHAREKPVLAQKIMAIPLQMQQLKRGIHKCTPTVSRISAASRILNCL